MRWQLLMCVLTLSGCAGQRAQETAFDHAVPATIALDPPGPIEIVEIPRVLPLPGQYTRKSPTPDSSRVADPAERIAHANAEARIEPAADAYVNAMQVWPYAENALYQLYTRPSRVTDIALEPGESLISASGADPVRWIIGDTTSGAGAGERVHIMVKPSRADLNTNLIIHTNRRSYHLELNSTSSAWMASVSWTYPQGKLQALRRENAQAAASGTVDEGLQLERLNFGYRVSGDKPTWRPLRVFDDGAKVYIQFPPTIVHDELPPLFVVGTSGDTQLVNYRVRSPYYIVDRLFAAAELRLGKPSVVVRIERDDPRVAARDTSSARRRRR